MNRFAVGLAVVLGSAGLNAEMQQLDPDLVEVEDADTLRVEVEGVSHRIQLPGVDAPESVPNPKLQRDIERTGLDAETLLALGRRADQGLRELLGGFLPYRLSFDPEKRDKYGRVPGELVNTAGQRLSVRLVEAGFAIPLRRGIDSAQEAELDVATARARAERRGLWGSHPGVFAVWAQPASVAPAK